MSENVQSPWPGPAGLIPVTSGRADDANIYNRNYLDSIHVEMRVIDAVEPNLKTKIFNEVFDSPIMMPAFSHLNKVGKNGKMPMIEYAKAAYNRKLVNWVGMEPNEEYANIVAERARTIRIIKPFADHGIIENQIQFAIEQGSFAVGIDIDHVPGSDGKYDIVDGIPLGPIMQTDIKNYVKVSGRIPFIAKGVLSVQDALKCKDAGCAAIVVSHHHGRLPFGVAPLMVLPRIKEALKGSGMTIFVDCGIDSGYDAYKALALGADAVSVGRGILKPLLQKGAEGVITKIDKMNEQLAEMMMYTCVKDTNSFDASVLSI